MNSFCIGLADDDSDEHAFFRDALALLNMETIFMEFESGKALLDHLQTALFLPDLLFIDINMPGMNGLDTLKMIKVDDKLKQIPVVICSTSAHKNDIHKAYKQGAELYFKKETSITQLAVKIEKIITALRGNKVLTEIEFA